MQTSALKLYVLPVPQKFAEQSHKQKRKKMKGNSGLSYHQGAVAQRKHVDTVKSDTTQL